MSGNLDKDIKLLLARREAVNIETKRLSEEIARERREEAQLQLELQELHEKSYKAIRQEREFWRNQIKSLKKQLIEVTGKVAKEKTKSDERPSAETNVELQQLAKALQKIPINKNEAEKKAIPGDSCKF